MASSTKQTRLTRKKKDVKIGRANKKARTKKGTPKFPIHPE